MSDKKFVIIIVLMVVFFVTIILGWPVYLDSQKKSYCGTVTSLYITSAGYKVSAEHHLVFYCKEINRKVNLKVTENCFSNAEVGKSICFDLLEDQTK